jgi:N-acetylglucosamine-6-phosphate deacetylase
MNHAIANVIRLGGLTLREAIRTATSNPARLIRLAGRAGGLMPGDRADIVVFRQARSVEIEAVYLEGECVVRHNRNCGV